MTADAPHTPTNRTGPSRVRWLVLLAGVLLLAAGLIIGASTLIRRGQEPLAQPLLTAPPPLTGTPSLPSDPDNTTSAAPVAFPPKLAEQRPRPSSLATTWKVLPDEPDLFSSAAPVVYSDGGVGTLLVDLLSPPAGKTLFRDTMSWTQNDGTVVCGRSQKDDLLICAFPTTDGGSVTVEGRGTTVAALAVASQDLQRQLPAS